MRIRKKKMELRYILLLIVLVVMLFIAVFSYTLNDNRKLSVPEKIIKDTIVGMQRIVYAPIGYVVNMIDGYKDLINIKKEYDILKDSVDTIDMIKTENMELKRQIEALKEELDIDKILTDYEYLNATVISRNIGYWYNTITIDKGSFNGVTVDMAVINSKGLIGKVISTTTFSSTIKLITTSDINSKISVTINNEVKDLYGLITGYDYEKNTLKIEGISNSDTLRIGDLVYTSGMGGVFPAGILVGVVETITTDNYDLSKITHVKPSADFSNINFVTVLKRIDGVE